MKFRSVIAFLSLAFLFASMHSASGETVYVPVSGFYDFGVPVANYTYSDGVTFTRSSSTDAWTITNGVDLLENGTTTYLDYNGAGVSIAPNSSGEYVYTHSGFGQSFTYNLGVFLAKPSINGGPAALHFQLFADESDSKAIEVWNEENNSFPDLLSYSIAVSAGDTWLTISASTGDSDGSSDKDVFTVTADAAGLALGTYGATLTVSTTEPGVAAQLVNVSLNVIASEGSGGHVAGDPIFVAVSGFYDFGVPVANYTYSDGVTFTWDDATQTWSFVNGVDLLENGTTTYADFNGAGISIAPDGSGEYVYSHSGYGQSFTYSLGIFSGEPYAEKVPEWWEDQVVTTFDAAADFAPANLGQTKHIVHSAFDAMESTQIHSAGSTIAGLVSGFTLLTADNYAPLNLGQLKALAKPFYDQMHAESHTITLTDGTVIASPDYPWDPLAPTDINYAPANLGQLKHVFSFELSGWGIAPELFSGDGLPNSWENLYFGNIGQTNGDASLGPLSDYDQDGFSDLDEYLNGRDPTLSDHPDVALKIFTHLE